MRKEFMEIMNQSKSEAEINNKKNKGLKSLMYILRSGD